MTIVDNSGSQSGDDCRHSMWGIYCEEGKEYRFYCHFCSMIITANFPRWSRTLSRTYEAEDVIKSKWACPGCCKRAPVLELMENEEWNWGEDET